MDANNTMIGHPYGPLPQVACATTPEQRALSYTIMVPFCAMVVGPFVLAALPEEVAVASVSGLGVGLSIGGVQEITSDHPIDVKVINTLKTGVVAMGAGYAVQATGVGFLGKGIVGVVGALFENYFKGQEYDLLNVMSVEGSGTNAMVAHALSRSVPSKYRVVVENAVMIVLELVKTHQKREFEKFEENTKGCGSIGSSGSTGDMGYGEF